MPVQKFSDYRDTACRRARLRFSQDREGVVFKEYVSDYWLRRRRVTRFSALPSLFFSDTVTFSSAGSNKHPSNKLP
jgi:hypothetical protein